LRGHIADPTGARIPGATITVSREGGAVVTTTTASAAGAYTVNGLPPGSYVVEASARGFAPFQSPAIPLAAGQIKRVDIAMAIEVAEQSVVVTDELPTVNVEASGNSNAIVIKGKDLDALSDDPDELASELQALAGPAAGPNGGQVYIDGFTGGQLPPKSAIREIRINRNPFSAEYDKLGYGRIEVFTKPGTDKAAWAVLCPGQRQRIQHRQPVHPDHSGLSQRTVQRHGERTAREVGLVFCQRGTAQQSERQHLLAGAGTGSGVRSQRFLHIPFGGQL
jgi:hypothetical protein